MMTRYFILFIEKNNAITILGQKIINIITSGDCCWSLITENVNIIMDFPDGSDSKESACNVGDLGSVPGLGRSPGGGLGNPFWYSSLENPMDRED